MDVNLMNEAEHRIEDRGKILEDVVQRIVDKHTKELTDQIHKIKSYLQDGTDLLTDTEIEDLMLHLPIILYEKTDDQEIVGLQADFASQIYKEVFSQNYSTARGTVGDKKSFAELQSMKNNLDQVIYDRAYKIIKQRMTMGVELLNAVKKIQSARQQRDNIGRF